MELVIRNGQVEINKSNFGLDTRIDYTNFKEELTNIDVNLINDADLGSVADIKNQDL